MLKAHQKIRDSENKVTMLVTENERLKQSKDDLDQQLQMWKKRHDQLSDDQMAKDQVSRKIRDRIKELEDQVTQLASENSRLQMVLKDRTREVDNLNNRHSEMANRLQDLQRDNSQSAI